MATTLDYIRRIYRAAICLSLTYFKCSLFATRSLISDAVNHRENVCDDIESIVDTFLTSLKILLYYPVYTMYRVHKLHRVTLQGAAHKWEDVKLHTRSSYELYDVVVSRQPYNLF